MKFSLGIIFFISFLGAGKSIELRKKTPGTHAQGIAADIAVSSGLQRYTIVKNAIKLGFTGIGVAGGFVHVDIRATDTPVMWTYS